MTTCTCKRQSTNTSPTFMILLLILKAHKKYLVSVFLICLPLLTPLITISYSSFILVWHSWYCCKMVHVFLIIRLIVIKYFFVIYLLMQCYPRLCSQSSAFHSVYYPFWFLHFNSSFSFMLMVFFTI